MTSGGYVGLSIATLLSQHHKVTAVDIVPEKVELINNKKSPIQDEYIEKYLAEKELNLVGSSGGHLTHLYMLKPFWKDKERFWVVTVGTHEQPFNRLIQKVDELKKDGVITEDVIVQTGFSTYEPQYCQWSKLIPYQQMIKNVADARIVITHGGPASFIMPLQIGKTPIVVPRQHQFNEHVNDHQVEFARNVAKRMGTIIEVEDIETLGDVITNYDQIVAGINQN